MFCLIRDQGFYRLLSESSLAVYSVPTLSPSEPLLPLALQKLSSSQCPDQCCSGVRCLHKEHLAHSDFLPLQRGSGGGGGC